MRSDEPTHITPKRSERVRDILGLPPADDLMVPSALPMEQRLAMAMLELSRGQDELIQRGCAQGEADRKRIDAVERWQDRVTSGAAWLCGAAGVIVFVVWVIESVAKVKGG